MLNLEYIRNAATLVLDRDACTGCGMCATVCPHGVFAITERAARGAEGYDAALGAAQDDCGCAGAGCCGGSARAGVTTAAEPASRARTAVRVAEIVNRDRCMECGACMMNCPAGAVTVNKGVGCAAAVIASRLAGREEITCGCWDEEDSSGTAGCGCGENTGRGKGSCC